MFYSTFIGELSFSVMRRLFRKSNLLNRKERVLSSILLIIFAMVMIGASALILILFENLMPINIYVVYLSVGIILGLSVIAIIFTIGDKNEC